MEHTHQLAEAVKTGDRAQIAQLLADNPALADAEGPDGVAFILLAAYHRKPDIAELIASNKSELNLAEAVVLGRAEAATRLLSSGSGSAAGYGDDGFSFLSLAAYFGHEELARLLIDNGAEPDSASKNSTLVYPLHAAVSSGNLAIARMLLSRGANPNVRQQGGITPLHGAAHNGNTEMVELLLSFGADPELRMDNGRRPLDMAVEQNFPAIVQLLCGKEAVERLATGS